MRQNRRIRLAGLILWWITAGGLTAGGPPAGAEPPLSEEPPAEIPAATVTEAIAPEPGETEGETESAAPEPGDEQVRAWNRELHAIADLLIDDQPAEAKLRAEKLLEETGLPDDVAARARELSAKAEKKLAPAPQPAKSEITITRNTSAKPGAGETFRVRLAAAGSGFREGTSGKLRVTSSGLAFTRDGAAREDWSIAWKDFQAARKEDGLWDAPFVLSLSSGGRQRYIARLDTNGRYLDGGPILAAIAKAQKEQP